MIYENELAELLKVSRTPIREAIRLLVSEEFLEVLPQRGTRITLISERKVAEARFIREQLEAGAFRLAAKLWNESVSVSTETRLSELLDLQQLAASKDDIASFFMLDETFHQTIMEVTGNTTLLQVINHMRAHINRIRFLAVKEFHQMDRVIAEHRELLDSIRNGDESLTATRLLHHLSKLDDETPQLRLKYPHYFID